MTVRPNQLLAIIGVIMLVSAIAGAVVIEEEPSAASHAKKTKTFHVSFPVTDAKQTTDGNTGDGNTVETKVRSAEANVTLGIITVTYTDNAPLLRPSAMVTVAVKGPNGEDYGSSTGPGSGNVGFPLDISTEVPKDINITAKSQEDAQKWVDENYPPVTNATGDWTVTITVQRAGFSGPLRQGSVDWTCELSYAFYAATIEEASK